MAINFLELATALKCLGAKWLLEKKLILRFETTFAKWMHVVQMGLAPTNG